jgi:hypothetical protein
MGDDSLSLKVTDTAATPVDDAIDLDEISKEEEADEERSAAELRVGDEVWVAARVVGEENPVTSVVRRKILAVDGSRIRVENGQPSGSASIRASLAFKSHGVLVITVGDFDSEYSLLDPLSHSLQEFLVLLLDPASVKFIKIRGLEELGRAWVKLSPGVSHVVVIGHGDEDGLFFGSDDYSLPGDELAETLAQVAGDPHGKTYLFLTCKSGLAGFAKKFSAAAHVGAVIAPLRSVHGAEAALFAQAFFTEHFLKGGTPLVAFNRVNKLPSLTQCRFRVWKNEALVATS